ALMNAARQASRLSPATASAAPRAGFTSQSLRRGREVAGTNGLDDGLQLRLGSGAPQQPVPKSVVLDLKQAFESLAPAGIGLAPALFQPAAEHHVKLLHAAPAAPAQSRRRLITAHIRWAPRWVDAVWPGGAPHLFRSFEFRSFEFVCYLQSGA